MEEVKLSLAQSEGRWFGCLIDRQDRLVASAFGQSSKAVQNHLTIYSRKTTRGNPQIVRHKIVDQMIELFSGGRSDPVQLNTQFISNFQGRVCRILKRIPEGEVTTYGLISRHLDSSPRAVGGAVASNPWPLFIPCHRVVNINLAVGNYSMCGSLRPAGMVTKRALLEREHVPLQGDKIDRSALWDPSASKN